jgi:hypothetical protein
MGSFISCKTAKLPRLILITSAWLGFLAPQVHSAELNPTVPNATPSGAAQPRAPVDKSRVSGKTPRLKIYIDPNTGEISKPPPTPPSVQPRQQSFEAAKDSSAELRKTQSPRPGGGVMIDLKGHFRSSLKATRGADGKLSVKHGSETSTSSEEK